MNLQSLSDEELKTAKLIFVRTQNFEFASQCRDIQKEREKVQERINLFLKEINKDVDKEREVFSIAINAIRDKFGISEIGMKIATPAIIMYERNEMEKLSEDYDNKNNSCEFSAQVKEIISYSREEAIRLSNGHISTEHFILGFIRDNENESTKALKSMGVDLLELRTKLEVILRDTGGNIDSAKDVNSLPLTPIAQKVIRECVVEAKSQNSKLVHNWHFMLALLKEIDCIGSQILCYSKVTYDTFKTQLTKL